MCLFVKTASREAGKVSACQNPLSWAKLPTSLNSCTTRDNFSTNILYLYLLTSDFRKRWYFRSSPAWFVTKWLLGWLVEGWYWVRSLKVYHWFDLAYWPNPACEIDLENIQQSVTVPRIFSGTGTFFSETNYFRYRYAFRDQFFLVISHYDKQVIWLDWITTNRKLLHTVR